MSDATNARPKIVTLQITYGANVDLSLDEVTESLTRILGEGVDELPAANRVSIFDQYVLIDGERVTPPMLAERQAETDAILADPDAMAAIAEGQAEITVDPEALAAIAEVDDLSPADRAALAKRQQKG